MYKYVGDGLSHFYGVPPRDLSDEEVAALGEGVAALLKASRDYRHEPDKKAKADAAPKASDGKGDDAKVDKP